MKLEKQLINLIKTASRRPEATDLTAKVLRIEGQTAWVHFDGGAEETPVEMSISCEPGDDVRVRINKGAAYIIGNNTNPPTNDRIIVKYAANLAQAAREVANRAYKNLQELLQTYVNKGSSNIDVLSTAMSQDENGTNVYGDISTAGDHYVKVNESGMDVRRVAVGGQTAETDPATAHIGTDYVALGERAEGEIGEGSYSEGLETVNAGKYSHVEGYKTIINPRPSGYAKREIGTHVEGYETYVQPVRANVDRWGNHVEGYKSFLGNQNETFSLKKILGAHVEGRYASVDASGGHAEGNQTEVHAENGHAEGNGSEVTGLNGHAEGSNTLASGLSAHTEGDGYSHGSGGVASGNYSHHENYDNVAEGNGSHAGGYRTKATGHYSFTAGFRTHATRIYKFVVGQKNVDKADTLFEVGNGNTTNESRDSQYLSNAFEVTESGYIRTGQGMTDIGFGKESGNMGYYEPGSSGAVFTPWVPLVNGKIPETFLPSYVDDVIEGYYNPTDGKFYEESTYQTETAGERGKIYISLDTDKSYRWSGTVFVELTSGGVVYSAGSGIDISGTNEISADNTIARKTDLSGYLPLAGGTMTGDLNFGDGIGIKGYNWSNGYGVNIYCGVELWPNSTTGNYGGYIDFHYNKDSSDNTSRIIENASGRLSINGALFSSNGKIEGNQISANNTGSGAATNAAFKASTSTSGQIDYYIGNSAGQGALEVTSNGVLGLWSYQKGEWVHYTDSSGNTTFNGNASTASRSAQLDAPRDSVSPNTAVTTAPAKTVRIDECNPNAAGAPEANWFHYITTHSIDTRYGSQLALGMTTNKVYSRDYNGGSWGDWKRLAFADEIPSVSGYLPLSGGTMNAGARITFTNSESEDGVYLNNGSYQLRLIIGSGGVNRGLWDGSRWMIYEDATNVTLQSPGTLILNNSTIINPQRRAWGDGLRINCEPQDGFALAVFGGAPGSITSPSSGYQEYGMGKWYDGTFIIKDITDNQKQILTYYPNGNLILDSDSQIVNQRNVVINSQSGNYSEGLRINSTPNDANGYAAITMGTPSGTATGTSSSYSTYQIGKFSDLSGDFAIRSCYAGTLKNIFRGSTAATRIYSWQNESQCIEIKNNEIAINSLGSTNSNVIVYSNIVRLFGNTSSGSGGLNTFIINGYGSDYIDPKTTIDTNVYLNTGGELALLFLASGDGNSFYAARLLRNNNGTLQTINLASNGTSHATVTMSSTHILIQNTNSSYKLYYKILKLG